MKYFYVIIGFFACLNLSAQTLQPATYSTNGSVYSMDHDENNLYIGGSFSEMGLKTNYFTIFPEGEDRPEFDLLQPNSSIEVTISDGNGGWYIGGSFSQINGENIARIAHILSDNTVDPDFNLSLNSTVYALTLIGDDLYIGGYFTNANSIDVKRLIRVDKNSGVIDNSWLPGILNGSVTNIFVSGDIVHVGGDFYTIEGSGDQRYYAQFDLNTAEPLASFSVNSIVSDMVADGNNLYLSGSFTQTGSYKSHLLSFDEQSIFPNQDFPDANSTVEVIEPDGNGGFYVGGSFSNIGGTTQTRLTHILADGSVDPDFSVTANSTVTCLALDGNDLYIGGHFTQINGTSVNYTARVNATTGIHDNTWLPTLNSGVYAIAVTGNTIHLGGSFSMVNGSSSTQYYAAIDKTTGETIQTESPASYVYDFESDGNNLFIGGSFYNSGYSQPYVQTLSADSDIPQFEFPTTNSTVNSAIPDGNGGWYIGGSFSNVGGVSALRVAHILSDNSVDPNFVFSANSTVSTLHLDGNNLYIGGSFTTINGETAIRVARVNKTTGALDNSWSANPNSTVYSIRTTSDKVLVGGSFYELNGNSNIKYLAILSKTDGEPFQSLTPNSTVNTIETDGDNAYIGGSFSAFEYTKSYLARFEAGSNIPEFSDSDPNSTVNEIIDDGSGGYYISGSFYSIDGTSTSRVAHILSDGTIDPNFTPTNINSTIETMALNGNDLYIGGSFNQINGVSIARLAKLNATTGVADETFAPNPNSTVYGIKLIAGTIYFGGSFYEVNGTSRNYLAAVNSSGVLQAWNPNANSSVYDLETDGTTLFAGGSFSTIGGLTANRLAGIDAATGAITAFNPSVNSTVTELLIAGSTLYIGGSFTQIDGNTRSRFASLNTNTGALNALTIEANNTVEAIALNGSGTIAIGGVFSQINGEDHLRFAEANIATGTLTGRNINFNSTVNTLYYQGTQLIAGGSFSTVNAVSSQRLSLFDTSDLTTSPTSVANVNSTVNDILLDNGTLYFSGSFTSVNSTARQRIAALTLEDGMLTALNPEVNSTVNTIALDGNILYLGGSFSEVNTTSRLRAAALNLNTGSLTDWNPTPNSTIETIAVNGSDILIGGSFSWTHYKNNRFLAVRELDSPELNPLTTTDINSTVEALHKNGTILYAGGSFTTFDGQSRARIAAFDLNTNTVTDLNISSNSTVSAIKTFNDKLYLGGSFTQINGTGRSYFAEYDLIEEALDDFNPSLNSTVNDIAVNNDRILIGGSFSASNVLNSQYVMAIDLSTGLPNIFFSGINSSVLSMAIQGNNLYLGGWFSQVGGESHTYFASINKLTGAINPLTHTFNSVIYDLEIVGDDLYAGGAFSSVNDLPRLRGASINLSNGLLNDFDPKFNSSVNSIAYDGTNISFGGSFTRTQTVSRQNFAAISLATNEPLADFGGNINSTVNAIKATPDAIYVGGYFTEVAGETRNRMASFSTSDGSLTDFNPNVLLGSFNGNVLAIAANGDHIYFAGSFSNVSGTARANFAGWDASSNSILPLEISSNNAIEAIEIGDGNLYLGGSFTQLMGETRNRIGAVNLSTGDLTTFNPSANNTVITLEFDGTLLYVGGYFSTIGGQTRQHLAALSLADGSANSWTPTLNGSINDIEIDENYLFATGSFTSLNGNTANRLVLLDKNSGENIFDFAPSLNYTGEAVKYFNETLYVSGQFTTINGNSAHSYLASWNVPPPGTPTFSASMASTIDINGFDIGCYGQSTGELEITVSGGTAPYTYTLTNTATLNRTGAIEGATAIESNLPAGNYTLNVEDDAGGIAVANLALTQPTPAFSVNATLTSPILTVDGDEASVTLTITGGVAPFLYTYTVDGGEEITSPSATNSILIENLTAGNYNFEITDDNGCTATKSLQINDYVLATVGFTIYDNITCNGDNDGRLRIQLTDGLAPYDYVLDSNDNTYDRSGTITYQNSSNIETNLGPGTYNVTVTDLSGAEYYAGPIVIEEPPFLSASISVTQHPSSLGATDGAFEVSISGGVANYSMLIYKDDIGIFYQTATSTTANVINQTAGSYYVVLTDANGCQITTNTVELIDGIDPCIGLGGDSDNDGICDDNDPCPLLANLENGDDCGINGTVVNCECIEECNLTLGTPIVTCLENTEGDDTYTVAISYAGIAPNATITTGDLPMCLNPDIAISGDDPTTNQNGTILLTTSEIHDCWSISIQSDLCDITLSGDSPNCSPAVDCPDLGLNNDDPCGDGGTVVDCQCLFPDCNGDLGGGVVDADDDGICDDIDNCLGLANNGQEDMDGDGTGDACDTDIDGDGIANADDCDPLDENIGLATNWYIDNDGDGYGAGDEAVSACTQPDGHAPVSGDCDDNDPDINPGAQTLTFVGSAGFEDAFISPLQGSPTTTFNFAIVYTDATGAIPPLGFPRVLLDFEGNGQFNNANDRAILLSPADQNDLNTIDGKVYIGSINQLPSGSNWEARIQVQTVSCITEIGPFDYPNVLIEPDLEIFADDIVFDNPNPDVSSPLQITATVRNTSDLPAENFVVHLVNQYEPGTVYPDKTVSYLGGHSTTTVVWNIITPDEPSWNPMEVFVDYTNVIEESNELDNRAMRPFTNGDYNVPGAIMIYPVVSPAIQFASPLSSVNVSGYAYYTDTAVPLQDSSVAGATISIINPITGGTVVGNTNSNGYFSISFSTGSTAGNYSTSGEITDYTLTGQFTVNWELLEAPCLPDLKTKVTLSSYQIFVGETIDGTITVTNAGCAPVEIETLLDATQTGGIPIIGDVMVPPLEPGESFTYNFSDVEFNTAGVYTICGYADAEFLVAELNENNNLGCRNVQVVPSLPDITPIAGPLGSAYFCSNLPFPAFTIKNIGYVPTGEFDYTVEVFYEGALSETYTQTILNLNANQSTTVTVPYIYENLGNYTFTVTCDTPMPLGIVTELSETNNISNHAISIIACKPDLTVLSCNLLDVDPEDLEIPGTATYTARVRNNGNTTADGPVDFEFIVSNGEVYALQYPNDIAPGETVIMTTDAPAVVSGTATLTAFVDPANLIEEFNENNNSVTDSLCWEYAAVAKCGYNFWNTTYYENQSAYLSVGLKARFLYKASEVKVRFEVSGPGITGTALLGDAIVENVEQNCNCPYVASLPTSFIFNEIGTYTFTMTADPDNEYSECDEGNNVLVREVQVSSFPDMRIVSEYINPTLLNPEPGESVFFDITYENIGVSNIDDLMNLTVLVDEITLSVVENVPGLITGQNTTIAIPVPYSSELAGAHVVRAIIDSDNEIQELNELNNEATRALIVGSAANLFFEVFIPSDSSPIIGDGIDIDATIGNNGDIDTEADVLFSYISNAGDTVQIGSIPVSVMAGGSQDISLPWMVLDNNTTLLGEIVNASEIEFDYTDNFASAPLSNFDVVIASAPSCTGQNLGSLTANASNGTPPYTYSWSNGFVGETLEAAAGTYSVTVTDSQGQEANASATINENPDCVIQTCDISAVSFNIPNCSPETGVYNTSLVVAYENAPEDGFISVNGVEYSITGSPQSFEVPFISGAVIYNVSFTASTDCNLVILTGTTLEECDTDCEGVYGGDALPGTECQTGNGTSGIYNDTCECVPEATITLLTIDCGGQVIQITGALAGDNDGGTATAETRTIYGFMPDNGSGTPSYSGTAWPYVIIDGSLNIDLAVTASLTTNADGILLINGWPAYQYVGDESSSDATGTFGPWNYFLPSGDLSQDACEATCDFELGDPVVECAVGSSLYTVTIPYSGLLVGGNLIPYSSELCANEFIEISGDDPAEVPDGQIVLTTNQGLCWYLKVTSEECDFDQELNGESPECTTDCDFELGDPVVECAVGSSLYTVTIPYSGLLAGGNLIPYSSELCANEFIEISGDDPAEVPDGQIVLTTNQGLCWYLKVTSEECDFDQELNGESPECTTDCDFELGDPLVECAVGSSLYTVTIPYSGLLAGGNLIPYSSELCANEFIEISGDDPAEVPDGQIVLTTNQGLCWYLKVTSEECDFDQELNGESPECITDCDFVLGDPVVECAVGSSLYTVTIPYSGLLVGGNLIPYSSELCANEFIEISGDDPAEVPDGQIVLTTNQGLCWYLKVTSEECDFDQELNGESPECIADCDFELGDPVVECAVGSSLYTVTIPYSGLLVGGNLIPYSSELCANEFIEISGDNPAEVPDGQIVLTTNQGLCWYLKVTSEECDFDQELNGESPTCTICLADAGSIAFADESTSITVCVDDNIPSMVELMFTSAPTEDLSKTWVVTDANGNLLALPATMADVENIDFDNAETGHCKIWYLSYDEENSNVSNLAASFADGDNVNASQFEGCFDLSNAIDVIRENCETPPSGCENFVYFLSDHSAADGIADIYMVTLNGGNADLDYIATSEIEVHIAYNQIDNLIYAVSKHTNSYRVLNPYAAVPTFGPTVDLGADYGELTAAAFNADGKLLIGSQNNNAIYSVNIATNVVSPYDTYAPVTGGDIAFGSDGMLYLATRTGNGLYEVWTPPTADQFIGSAPSNVTGLAITDADKLLMSSKGSTNLMLSNSDGSPAGSYAVLLNGEPYTLRDGDMASGCDSHTNVEDDCGYKLYYIHAPAAGGNRPLLEVTLNNDGTASYNAIIANIGGHIGLSPDGATIYNVTGIGTTISTIDVATASIVHTANIVTTDGTSPDRFPACLVSADGTVYIGSNITNQVYTIDPLTGTAVPFGPSRTVQGGDLIEVDGEIWVVTRNDNRFTNVLTGENFTVPVNEINGAAVLSNGNVLLSDGNGGSLMKEVDISTQEIVATYDIGLPLMDGDLAGGCTMTNPLIEGCYGVEILDFNQGAQTNGGAVAGDRSDENEALGEPDRSNAPGGFVSLGVGGHITIGFAGVVNDEPGNDIKIYETSYSGDACGSSDDERADIELSADGVNFVSVGTICRDGEVDMADVGLTHVSAIRITNSASTGSLDGYDVDGVEAIYGCGSALITGDDDAPRPAEEAASELTSYPNPTSGPSQVVFSAAETGTTIVEVYDMNGRNVATLFNQVAKAKQEYRLDFDGNYLPNGVYIYRLTTNNETIINKFMIAK